MRISMMVATALLLSAGAGVASASPTLDTPFLVTSAAQTATVQPPAQPGGDTKVDINLTDDRTVWYTDPLWLVLGAAAVIVIVALVAAAARGGRGGTTVIR